MSLDVYRINSWSYYTYFSAVQIIITVDVLGAFARVHLQIRDLDNCIELGSRSKTCLLVKSSHVDATHSQCPVEEQIC